MKSPSNIHKYLANRVPIDQVAINWNAGGYTSDAFNQWAGGADFPGWRGDLPDEDEARVMVRLLNAGRGDSLLDVACGYGRHAVVLAQEHHLKVTGIDLSPGIIAAARKRAAQQELKIAYVVKDARELAWKSRFDHAIIALNSFSLFSPRDAPLVLRAIHQALTPMGNLFIDIDNKPFACRYGTSTNDWYLTPGGLTLQETYFHQDSSVEVSRDLIFTRDDALEVEEFMHFMRIYSQSEITELFGECGYRVEQAYGGWDLSSLGSDSPKILLVGSKV